MKKNNKITLLTFSGIAMALCCCLWTGQWEYNTATAATNDRSVMQHSNGKDINRVKDDTQTAPLKPKQIHLALLLDTSNSMDGLIEQAKSQLWNIVDELAEAKYDGLPATLQIALYEYGNDHLSIRQGYVRQVSPFTKDLDEISEQLFSLKTNGGSEYCGAVIKKAMDQLAWSASPADLKMIFIAGNEGFDQGLIDFKVACKAAAEKDIVVNTIFCGDYHEGIDGFWQQGAKLAQGDYMNIDMDEQTVYTATPYDDQIDALNDQLNDTYVGYGQLGERKKQMQVQQDQNASSYSKMNKVKRTISKSKHVYTNEAWDLVDAQKNKGFDLKDVKTEELPEEMKSMSPEERQEYIEQKTKERKQIQTKIQALGQQRKTYINQVNDSSKTSNELETAILKAVKEKASKKQLTFE